MVHIFSMLSSSSTTWRQQLACCLVFVVVMVNLGLVQCEHDIDLGHLSADEVLIPTNNKLYPSYFVPFRAMDTARYLSALRRHKRGVWLVPKHGSVAGNSDYQRHHRGHRSYQTYSPFALM